jgi:type VI secretion system activator RovC-like protein
MPQTPLDPPVSDQAPDGGVLTDYDQEHLVTYLRLLDAEAEGADWAEVAGIVLHIDPKQEPERARRAWESHLTRAKWMMQHGYRDLLESKKPADC